MGIALSSLIEQIGISVQKANALIEQTSVAAYLEQGYEKSSNMEDDAVTFVPVSYTINIPSPEGKKQLHVPVTALMHHTSLKLEQVDVNLKFLIEEKQKEDIIVSLEPTNTFSAAVTSELSLQFKNTPPTEGMARIDQRHIQTL